VLQVAYRKSAVPRSVDRRGVSYGIRITTGAGPRRRPKHHRSPEFRISDATDAMEQAPDRYGPSIQRAYRATHVIAEYTGGYIDILRLRESLAAFVAERSAVR
jgi:hypothetical protein